MIKKGKLMSHMTSLILIISIVLMIGATCQLYLYTTNNAEQLQNTALNGMSMLSSDISNRSYTYLEDKFKNLKAEVEIINTLELTKDETLELFSTENNSENYVLINLDDYLGYSVDKDTGETVQSDFSEVSEIVLGCDSIFSADVPDTTEIDDYTTEVFTNSEGENCIAFYCGVEISDELWGAFYMLPLSSLMKNIVGQQGSSVEDSFMLDSDGTILYKGANYSDITEENFLDYLGNEFGESNVNKYASSLLNDESGTMSLKDSDGNKSFYTFCRTDLADGWIYVRKSDQTTIEDLQADGIGDINQEDKSMAIMIIPLILDLAIITILTFVISRRRKHMEKMNEQLKKANDAQNIFISNMSHEIRTPINAVLGMDEMIIRESSEENIIGYATDIQNAGKSLLGIVNDILDFTKIEAGKIDIIEQEYDIGSTVNDLVNMVSKRMSDKNLEFNITLDETTPHLLVGDELRIKQIILNILTNAAKYTDKGHVDFKIGYEKINETSMYMNVSISDTGIGMKAEEMDKLYKPFERLDEKRNRTVEGTGLGMSIVVRLLKQMGSELEVDSVYGEGSCFSFKLIQRVVDWEGVGKLTKHYENRVTKENSDALFIASKAKVLVVDDTPVNITVVCGLLKRTRVQIDTATSGLEALALTAKDKYDVILLDHRMPEMDGVETLHRMRNQDEQNTDTPIIALTANVVSGAMEYYKNEGFDDFLSKPVNGVKLERMLLKYIPPEKFDTADDLAIFIDEAAAIKISGSKELYDQVCQEFVSSVDSNLKTIDTLWEQGDIENFTIKVHALKSSARLVGAMYISDEAKYLENCGNEKNTEEIKNKLPQLIENTSRMANQLKSKYEVVKDDMPEISKNQFSEIISAMKEFLEVYDFDQIDFCVDNLRKYRMPDKFDSVIKELYSAVADVDAEKIKELLERISE